MLLQLPIDAPDFVAECNTLQDREILIDLLNGRLEPKRAPAVLDFVGRSYTMVENDKRFHDVIKKYFQDVIWKRFQKVVWSPSGTVGIDVPIQPSHVKTFLSVAQVKANSAKFIENVLRFLSAQAKLL